MPVFAAKMAMPSDIPPAYENECASCHMAYPPGLLGQKIGKASCQTLISTLEQMQALIQKNKAAFPNGLLKILRPRKNIHYLYQAIE